MLRNKNYITFQNYVLFFITFYFVPSSSPKPTFSFLNSSC